MKSIGERIYPSSIESVEEYVLYLKHFFAYDCAKRKLGNGSKVLEVGCGEGYGTSVLAQTKADVIGVDIDLTTIDSANDKYGEENCRYQLFDGKKLPFEDDEFDVVVSFQVIEHVPDDIAFLNEIKRVLKVGGELYVATPNRSYRLRPNQAPWNRFHLREYSHSDFDKLLKVMFDSFKMYGVSANPVVKEIETSRVYPNKFNYPLSSIIGRWQRFKNIIGRKRRFSLSEAKSEISASDFFLTDSGIEDSLDLFGICIKEASATLMD